MVPQHPPNKRKNLCILQSSWGLADSILPLQMGATPSTSSAFAPHKRTADYPARLSNSSLLATQPGDAAASDQTDGSDSTGQVLHADEVSPLLVLPQHRLRCCWYDQSMCWHRWEAWLAAPHSPSMLNCQVPTCRIPITCATSAAAFQAEHDAVKEQRGAAASCKWWRDHPLLCCGC